MKRTGERIVYPTYNVRANSLEFMHFDLNYQRVYDSEFMHFSTYKLVICFFFSFFLPRKELERKLRDLFREMLSF